MNITQSEYIDIIESLHSVWTPHPGQIRVGKCLIQKETSEVFICAGRNFGKSELMAYLLWRWALVNPGSENYYFSPFMKQSREILWSSRRVQTFGPSKYLNGTPNETEMRIKFKNGSFIKLDGSDNVEAYRGVKPKGLTVFDEFKDFRPEFYDAYEPNRAAHDSPLVIIGTPPDRECQFTELMNEFQTNKSKRFFHAPTSENPYISRQWLENKRKELIARGDEHVWEREYEAKFVKGGKSRIFPMLTNAFVKHHNTIIQEIYKDRSKLQWYCICDPGTITCFAVLFAAINPYTKQIYLLDEIYETDQTKTTVKLIGTQMLAMMRSLYPKQDDWSITYDEAEAWFASEMLDNFDLAMMPTRKALNDKESGLALIKDALIAGKIQISDRCVKLFWEMDSYYKDKNGRIPKLNDHLIDTTRYLLSAANYSLNSEDEPEKIEFEPLRSHRISDDFPTLDEWGHDASLFD